MFIVLKLYLSDKQMEKLDQQIKRKIKRSKVITTGKNRSTSKNQIKRSKVISVYEMLNQQMK